MAIQYDPHLCTYYPNIGYCYSPQYYYEEGDPAQRTALCEKYQQVLIDEGFVLKKVGNTSENEPNYTYTKAWRDGCHIVVFIVPTLPDEETGIMLVETYAQTNSVRNW